MRSPAYYGWRAIPVAIVLLFAWAVVMSAVSIRAESGCLERGYPRASVTMTGSAYCIRTVLQTDYVVSLDELRRTGSRAAPDSLWRDR